MTELFRMSKLAVKICISDRRISESN